MRALLIAADSGSASALSRRLEGFAESVVQATSCEAALRELQDPSYRYVVIDTSVDFARELALAGSRMRQGKPSQPSDDGLIGCSAGIVELRKLIRSYGACDAPVLVCGETGTGKELVARALHEASARRLAPFVPVNCAAISASIFESEVFGSVRGAYTGSVRDHGGLVGAARGGTLFLDEVGELGPELQAKLLRLLEDGSYRQVGATREARADVRVLAATNRDLLAASEAGSFRADLLFRLDVLRIEIPPLRERRPDVPLLVDHFLSELSHEAPQPTAEAIEQLVAYPWPGNVRELRHTVERTLAHHTSGPIRRFELRLRASGASKPRSPVGMKSARITLARLIEALERHQGRIDDVAREFDVSVRTIQRRMATLELRVRDFRPASTRRGP